MAASTRTKRITDTLHEKLKSRLFDAGQREPFYGSRGSEHHNHHHEESPRLSCLLCDFLEEDAGETQELPGNNDSDSEHDPTDAIDGLNQAILSESRDEFRNALLIQVSKALQIFSFVMSNKSLIQRNVMAFLRSLGYNAAICNTKWESSGGLTAGNYEFIDVVRSESGNRHIRYFIDLDFAEEFEIARQTDQYKMILRFLPKVFIGRTENLKQIVKVMSDAARRSLKSRGLHLPPWRKNRFMQNRWFGPFRRTVNLVSSSSSALSTTVKQQFGVKCRSVGFDAGDGRSPFPAAACTK